MKKILHINNPNDYLGYVSAPSLHPLIGIIHYDELEPFRHSLNNYGVYGLFIQKKFYSEMSYGNERINVALNSILAVAPGQMGGVEDNGELITLNGWVILWSPELIHNTSIENRVKGSVFFNYFYTTPLQMNESEWDQITGILSLLRAELSNSEDSPSQRKIIIDYISLILDYCDRIHIRQQNLEDTPPKDILKKFQGVLNEYFESGKQYDLGIPSVKFCAGELAYSPRYFGDQIQKLTGNTAIAYIHSYVVSQAKSLLKKGYNVNETARLLGFKYTNHFTRLFKNFTGENPSKYR